MKRIVLVVVLLASGFFLDAQSAWQLKRWTIGTGYAGCLGSTDPRVTISKWYPGVTEAQPEYSGYRFDKTVRHVPEPPVGFEFSLTFVQRDSGNHYSGKWQLRFMAGVEQLELFYTNRVSELPNKTPMQADTVRRIYYGAWWNVVNAYVGAEALLYSRPLGPRGRWRLRTGGGIAPGMGFSNLTTYRSDGTYLVRGASLDDGVYNYNYMFPALYNVTQTMHYTGPTLFSCRVHVPLGAEFAFGARKRFRLSESVKLGNTWFFGERGVISGAYVSAMTGFTFEFNR